MKYGIFSLSQIPLYKFSVCKKGKQKDATCTLDCNNPWNALTKGLYLYTRTVKMFIINLIVRKSPPPSPKVCPCAQLVNKKNKKWQVNY